MTDATDFPGISFEATLPLEWATLPSLTLANSELQRQGNVALLRALSAIETVVPEHELHAEASQKALERIEAKLDIVFLLVARLAGAAALLPPEKKIILSAEQVIWQESGNLPAIGQTVQVSLTLNPRLPQPLLLPVSIKELRENESGAEVVATLQACGDELKEWLTRTIFRYHRRALQARKHSV